MSYRVKELFKSIQGEGYWSGRPAIFVRFVGCNLWSGTEEDRKGAVCQFCDTDFLGGERMTMTGIVERSACLWGDDRKHRFVVLTGGEPMLQVDYSLIATFHRFDFYVAIETNGTRKVDVQCDWITVSPKSGSELVQMSGDELKLVYPQNGFDPAEFREGFSHYFLQPKDGVDREQDTSAAVRYCMDHPRWRLSLQTHKFIGLR